AVGGLASAESRRVSGRRVLPSPHHCPLSCPGALEPGSTSTHRRERACAFLTTRLFPISRKKHRTGPAGTIILTERTSRPEILFCIANGSEIGIKRFFLPRALMFVPAGLGLVGGCHTCSRRESCDERSACASAGACTAKRHRGHDDAKPSTFEGWPTAMPV